MCNCINVMAQTYENYLLTEEEVAQMREIATKAAMKFVKQKCGI